jgi:hypothetical protein
MGTRHVDEAIQKKKKKKHTVGACNKFLKKTINILFFSSGFVEAIKNFFSP